MWFRHPKPFLQKPVAMQIVARAASAAVDTNTIIIETATRAGHGSEQTVSLSQGAADCAIVQSSCAKNAGTPSFSGCAGIMAAKWKNGEVRDFDGLICSSGETFEVQASGMVAAPEGPQPGEWIDVGMMAQEELSGGQYTVKCGESSAHGSIGVIVLECRENRQPVWTFVSHRSNPFNQIVIKSSSILVLSTSGAVFRFVAPLTSAALLLP